MRKFVNFLEKFSHSNFKLYNLIDSEKEKNYKGSDMFLRDLTLEALKELLEEKIGNRDYLNKCYKNKKYRGYYDGYDADDAEYYRLDNDLDEINVVSNEIEDIKRELIKRSNNGSK